MPKTVLVVEDDAPTQDLLRALMTLNGIPVVIAADGGAAIELLGSRNDLGCIILDLMMPNVDGRAVLAHVSSSERRLPTIICTAVVPRYIPEFDPGIVRAVVQKPFDVEKLLALVLPLVS